MINNKQMIKTVTLLAALGATLGAIPAEDLQGCFTEICAAQTNVTYCGMVRYRTKGGAQVGVFPSGPGRVLCEFTQGCNVKPTEIDRAVGQDKKLSELPGGCPPVNPTEQPTGSPTPKPTDSSPTPGPTVSPTGAPTTASPTGSPTPAPTYTNVCEELDDSGFSNKKKSKRCRAEAECIWDKPNCFLRTPEPTGTPTTAPTQPSCSALWKQCGGKNWNGPTCCEAGSKCETRTAWYSQCKPVPT